VAGDTGNPAQLEVRKPGRYRPDIQGSMPITVALYHAGVPVSPLWGYVGRRIFVISVLDYAQLYDECRC